MAPWESENSRPVPQHNPVIPPKSGTDSLDAGQGIGSDSRHQSDEGRHEDDVHHHLPHRVHLAGILTALESVTNRLAHAEAADEKVRSHQCEVDHEDLLHLLVEEETEVLQSQHHRSKRGRNQRGRNGAPHDRHVDLVVVETHRKSHLGDRDRGNVGEGCETLEEELMLVCILNTSRTCLHPCCDPKYTLARAVIVLVPGPVLISRTARRSTSAVGSVASSTVARPLPRQTSVAVHHEKMD